MAYSICGSAREYLDGLRAVIDRVEAAEIDGLVDLLYETWKADRKVLVFGNGGSAYTSSHFVTDLVKTAGVDGMRRLRAFSLVDNYGLTTAIGNDIDYDHTLIHPLESYARSGDLALAISGSGNSPNVVAACEWAKEHGLTLVCLTGFSGGKIGPMADLQVHIPSDNYGYVEDLHLSIGHMISQSLKTRIQAEAN